MMGASSFIGQCHVGYTTRVFVTQNDDGLTCPPEVWNASLTPVHPCVPWQQPASRRLLNYFSRFNMECAFAFQRFHRFPEL